MTQKIKRVAADYRRTIVLAVLLVVAMAWDTDAARAQYQPTAGTIRVLLSNRCLDADAGGGGNGTTVQLWDCWGGANQNWVMSYDNSILNMQFSTKCLDADTSGNGANGTKVQLWDCNGGPNQKWNFTLDGTLVNQQFSKCLDADLGSIQGNGTIMRIWDCSMNAPQPNQKWWAAVQSGFLVKVSASGKCLDADAPTIGWNGTVVQLWDCNGGPNQHWNMLSDGTIRNIQSHRCLDADSNTAPANGTKVQLWDCNGGQNQKWIWRGYDFGAGIVGSDNQTAYSFSRFPACLDADVGTIGANGTRVQLWRCWGGQNQFWWNPTLLYLQ